MHKNLKNIFVVSTSTVASRVSGFMRDALFFSVFSVSDIGAAFLFAFVIPNLFRRLLGEGALASAIIPILSKQYVNHGKNAVFALLQTVIIKLSVILVAITIVGCSVSFSITKCTFLAEKWILGAHFLVLLLPYTIFVCIAAIISAALNVFGHFFIASLNAIWLNACMIFSLIFGKVVLKLSGITLLDCLCLGVVLGGVIQCLVPLFELRKIGFKKESINISNSEIREILHLFWPGLFGAAVSQINILLSRSLAYTYDASAVSILYLANRLIELPLGIFGIAVATVFFPDMSKLATNDCDKNSLNKSFNDGFFGLIWILLPSTIGLFSIRKEILSVFFEWGNFSIEDAHQTLPIIAIYCASIPFYGICSFLMRSFHAIKDMETPVHVGIKILLLNVTLTIILMNFFGIRGIATANTVSSVAQTWMLYNNLHKKHSIFSINVDFFRIMRVILGTICIYLCIKIGQTLGSSLTYNCKYQALQIFIIFVPLAAIVYLLVAGTYIKSCKK